MINRKYVFKFCIVGSQSVGKTSFYEYLTDEFKQHANFLIPVYFKPLRLEVYHNEIIVQIWDKLRDIPLDNSQRAFYLGASGLFLIFDKAREETLDELKDIIKSFLEIVSIEDHPSFILIGNKVNNATVKMVSDEKITQFTEDLSEKYGTYIPYFEMEYNRTNAIDDALKSICKLVLINKGYQVQNINSLYKFNKIDYLLESEFDDSPISVNTLKNFIESSCDETIEIGALSKLQGIIDDPFYLEELLRRETLNSLTTQFIRFLFSGDSTSIDKIIFNSKNKILIQNYIIQEINDYDYLEKIYLTHPNTEIREIAFNQLIEIKGKPTLESLKKIIWSNNNLSMQINAINQLEDQDELSRIIFNSKNLEIQKVAISKLKIPISEKIKNILNQNYPHDLKSKIIEKIKNDKELINLIRNHPSFLIKREAFFELSNYPINLLKEIIYNNYPDIYPDDIRIAAVRKLRNDFDLIDIIFIHTKSKIKIEALLNIKEPSQKLLKRIICTCEDDELIKKSIESLNIDQKMPLGDLTEMLKVINTSDNLKLLIKRTKSLKHLELMRLTLNPIYQILIRERMYEVENQE